MEKKIEDLIDIYSGLDSIEGLDVYTKLQDDIENYLAKLLNLSDYYPDFYYSEDNIKTLVNYFFDKNNLTINNINNFIKEINKLGDKYGGIFIGSGDMVIYKITRDILELIFGI